MDMLRLLSRGTKTTKRSSQSKAPELPSNGAARNPQLYNDLDVAHRGTKRKHVEIYDIRNEEVSDAEVDFFAPKSDQRGPIKHVAKQSGKASPTKSTSDKPVEAARLLDVTECQKVLRSHRVKITRLPLPGQGGRVEDGRIRKKTSKISKLKQDLGEAEQLFPQPLEDLKDLSSTYGISRRLAENLAAQGYKIPTEVQLASLPMLLSPARALSAAQPTIDDRETSLAVDLLVVAPTGSGKTLAFLIPIVNAISQRRRSQKQHDGHTLEAIVVAPTKELASQIVNEARKMVIGTGIRVVEMRKGMRITNEAGEHDTATSSDDSDDERSRSDAGHASDTAAVSTNQPAAKVDILVTTPLVLVHALQKSDGSTTSLPTVLNLVLDEADVLLDPLFRDQTSAIWDACSNAHLRATLWSATMGSNIETLAMNKIVKRRSRLEISSVNPVVRLVVGLKDSAVPNIAHKLIYTATEAGKLLALRQILHPTTFTDRPALRPPFLIFTQTIPRATALHSELLYDIPVEAGGSSRLAVLHSNLSSSARSNIMTRFRNGEIWVLITTDILSRGVDFRGINGVVNYDVPNSGAAYIHRVGRTGRAGREGGVGITFYTKEDIPYVRNIATIIAASEKQAGIPPSEAGMQKWLLDALPKPSKHEKKELKLRGVEARRTGTGEKRDSRMEAKMRISSKSGFERRLDNKKRGAIEGSRRRKALEDTTNGQRIEEEGEWQGID